MTVRPLKSGTFEARFTHKGRAHSKTWDTHRQAVKWEERTRRALTNGTYINPDTGLSPTPVAEIPMFKDYALAYVAKPGLKPRTRSEYTALLASFGPLDPHPLDEITRTMVKAWFAGLTLAPNGRKHAYELARAIFNAAVDDEHIDVNPARIKGATRSEKRVLPDLPTAARVHQLADAMPTAKYRTMTLISAWCGLRFGESTELRRKDVLLDDAGQPLAIRVRRGVVRVDGEFIVGTPKSAAGSRDVVIPPHIRGDFADYLNTLPAKAEALIFPGTRNGRHMAPSSLYKPFYKARATVGLPTLRWHDLRHFSATTAAQSGATLAELQARLGHSTAAAALRYQQAVSGRDAVVAEAMSANVVALKPRAAS